MKKRNGYHERTIRELDINEHGIVIGEPLDDFQASSRASRPTSARPRSCWIRTRCSEPRPCARRRAARARRARRRARTARRSRSCSRSRGIALPRAAGRAALCAALRSAAPARSSSPRKRSSRTRRCSSSASRTQDGLVGLARSSFCRGPGARPPRWRTSSRTLGNVSVVERPVRMSTLVTLFARACARASGSTRCASTWRSRRSAARDPRRRAALPLARREHRGLRDLHDRRAKAASRAGTAAPSSILGYTARRKSSASRPTASSRPRTSTCSQREMQRSARDGPRHEHAAGACARTRSISSSRGVTDRRARRRRPAARLSRSSCSDVTDRRRIEAEREHLLAVRARRAQRSRARQPHEGRVPRHAQPRAAHAAERDPRLGADAAAQPERLPRELAEGARASSSATRARRRRSSKTCST